MSTKANTTAAPDIPPLDVFDYGSGGHKQPRGYSVKSIQAFDKAWRVLAEKLETQIQSLKSQLHAAKTLRKS